MIVKIDQNSNYIEKIEKIFSNILKIGQISQDIQNNVFTSYFAYLINNQVVAFIHYDIMYERAELMDISVQESYQNQKIASKLMEKMIEDCKNKKVKSITLEVRVNNQNAIHLYTKYGFQEVSIRKGYYQGIDGILMEKELM